MNKTEIKQCINETIVPNNEHGITAESLNLILNEMVDNSGEGGSGDGALRVIVPDMVAIGPEFIAMGELSLASWEEVKPIIEAEGIDVSEYDAIVKAAFEHNANVAQQIIAKAKAGQGASVVLDQTPYLTANLTFVLQEMAEYIEEYATCGVQPAGLLMQYVKFNLENEPDDFVCTIAPTGNIYLDGMNMTYPSNMLIQLNLDGSLLFEVTEEEQPSSGSGVVTFYTNPSGEITEEQKEKNVEAFSKYAAGIPISAIVNNEGQEATYYPFATAYQENKDVASELSFIVCSFPIKMANGDFAAMIFYEDGSVVMQME